MRSESPSKASAFGTSLTIAGYIPESRVFTFRSASALFGVPSSVQSSIVLWVSVRLIGFPCEGGVVFVMLTCMPLTYDVDVLRDVMLRGADWSDIWSNLLVLFCLLAVFFILSALGFRKKRAYGALISECPFVVSM